MIQSLLKLQNRPPGDTKMASFWLKLPFMILKMSEMDSASSLTSRTTQKSTKPFLFYYCLHDNAY